MLFVTERHETIGTLLAGCYRHVTSTLLAAVMCVTLCQSSAQATVYQRFIVGTINVDTADHAISAGKVEAGLAVALTLTKWYRLIPTAERDSILATLPAARRTIADAAQATHAVGALFITTRRIANLVRTEVVVMSGEGMKEAGRGVGYGLVRFKTAAGETAVADPAILASLQRALCLAMHDSTLYDAAEDDFRVRPTALIGTGGIAFVDTSGATPWNLFAEKIVVSYDGEQTIANETAALRDFTTIDVETRDTMYSKAKLFLVENYNMISALEIRVLRLFDVRYVVIGSFDRTRSGAVLTLTLCELVDDRSFKPRRSVHEECTKDEKVAFRECVKAATAKLFAGS